MKVSYVIYHLQFQQYYRVDADGDEYWEDYSTYGTLYPSKLAAQKAIGVSHKKEDGQLYKPEGHLTIIQVFH